VIDAAGVVVDRAPVVDEAALERLEQLGLAERRLDETGETVALTTRGRFLGGGVTAELLS
jgi:hypothetical protein